jgi:hypothetical protein
MHFETTDLIIPQMDLGEEAKLTIDLTEDEIVLTICRADGTGDLLREIGFDLRTGELFSGAEFLKATP